MPLTENEPQFLDRVLLGHRPAVAFCQQLGAISQIWDDLVDGDKEVSSDEINAAFWRALVEVPANPFYQQHFTHLQPLIQAAITDWLDANELERGSTHEQQVAWVLRDSVGAIVVHCAYLVGGYAHMREVSLEIRRALYDESFDEYKEVL